MLWTWIPAYPEAVVGTRRGSVPTESLRGTQTTGNVGSAIIRVGRCGTNMSGTLGEYVTPIHRMGLVQSTRRDASILGLEPRAGVVICIDARDIIVTGTTWVTSSHSRTFFFCGPAYG